MKVVDAPLLPESRCSLRFSNPEPELDVTIGGVWRRRGVAGQAHRSGRAPGHQARSGPARGDGARGHRVRAGTDHRARQGPDRVRLEPAAERMFGWPAGRCSGRAADHPGGAEGRAQRGARTGRGRRPDLAAHQAAAQGRRRCSTCGSTRSDAAHGGRLGWVVVCHPATRTARCQAPHGRARAGWCAGSATSSPTSTPSWSWRRCSTGSRPACIELTGADAGGFVLIEGERLRLVSMDGLPDDAARPDRRPAHQPGRRAACAPGRR